MPPTLIRTVWHGAGHGGFPAIEPDRRAAAASGVVVQAAAALQSPVPSRFGDSINVSRARDRMSQLVIVRFALNNRWLEERGVPDLNALAAVAALKICEA